MKGENVADRVFEGLYEGVSTYEIDNLASDTAASMTTKHPDYSMLASRIAVSQLHKRTEQKFSENMKSLFNNYNVHSRRAIPLVSKELYEIVQEYAEVLDSAIDYSRDFDYNYIGFKTLEKSYLLRMNGKIAERPQSLLMRVSVGIHGRDIDKAIETYNLMSLKYFTHASPTLYNAGTPIPQMSSCFLIAMKDDSIEGIYDTLKTCAVISKSAGGIGVHCHNIRAKGSHIAGTNGTSNGLIPMLRVYNDTARYVDQGGNKRPGAFAMYLEPWHPDIFDFLELRKNHGKEELRARDLFYALWIPDLFMEKVEKNEDWCLFCPQDAPGLADVYGEEFNQLYYKYEKEGRQRSKIKAQKLWCAILESQTESGTPYMLYKDACNRKSNQKNLGTIKSSNLCAEIIEYSSPEEVAVCNLASLALLAYVKSDEPRVWYDFEGLHEVTKVVVKNLNKIIDISFYPVEEAKKSNLRHRPVAVGVQGLADVFMALGLPFESIQARKLNIQIFETIYHAAVEASIELAKQDGPYESYEGSPASNGQLQFDLWDHKPTNLWDWDTLKNDLARYGLRNSLLVAPMPTASTSQILGLNECFEPYTSNMYSRRILSGEFQILNQWLLKDLIELGLWNDGVKNLILENDGSIQNIDCIPDDIKVLYKTVWEISQRTIIDMAADRAKFIDQSQSLNIYLKNPSMGKLTSMHFYGWKKGLKTGMYYLRTQAASQPTKFTVDQEALTQVEMLKPVKALKKRTYMEAEGSTTTLSASPTDSLTDGDENDPEASTSADDKSEKTSKMHKIENGESYDIHNTDVIVCEIGAPENCDACSG